MLAAAGASDTYFIATADDTDNLYGMAVDSDGEYIWWGGYAGNLSGSPKGWMTVLNLDGTVNASKEIQNTNSEILDGVIMATNNQMVTVGNGRISSTYSSDRGYVDWNSNGGASARGRNQSGFTERASGIGYSGSGNVFYTIGNGIYSSTNYITVGKVTHNGSSFSENESKRFQFFSSYPTMEAATYGGIAVDSTGKPIVAGYYMNVHRYNTSFGGDVGKDVSLLTTEYNNPSLAVDSNDNVILSGWGRANSSSYQEALLIKFNQSDFSVAWANAMRQGTSTQAGQSYSCCVDSSDNVYMCGALQDGLTGYGFIAKYNSSGTLQWRRRFYVSGSYPTFVWTKIKTDPRDNVLATGYINNGSDRRAIFLKIPTDGIDAQSITIDSRSITIADPSTSTLRNTSWTPSLNNYGPSAVNTGSTTSSSYNVSIANSGYTNTIQEV